jgi:hypothetical protein
MESEDDMKGFKFTKGIGWHAPEVGRPTPPIPRERRMGMNPAFIRLEQPKKGKR